MTYEYATRRAKEAARKASRAEVSRNKQGYALESIAWSLVASNMTNLTAAGKELARMEGYEAPPEFIKMPDRCEPEEGLHVAREGERRCMCPEKMKIT